MLIRVRYRPCEYDAEDGPWDPFTGGASALLGTLSSLMVGIADLPVAAINGLRTSVQQSNAEYVAKQAARSAATSPTSSHNPSTTDLNLAKASTPDPATSSRTDLSSSSTLDGNNAASTEDGVKVEAKEVEPSLLSQDKRAHAIQISTVHHAQTKHTHHIDPGDKYSHKAAVRAEQGATAAAAATLRPAMDFTLAVARGFHNAPKLYGDDTVRAQNKIVDFKTGVAAAGTEFGYGWYDGISGLVTQPFNGAKKNGVRGFLEGIGKGVSGLVLKPGAGKCSPFLLK